MKILHTSDWHLGRALYGHKRYEEFEKFLLWLVDTIDKNHIDVLLIAGDIFDTSTPSNRAQALYYHFLSSMVSSVCRHIVIIAGNHDSPTFLDAPKTLLRALNVYVIGAVSLDLRDEVLVLKDLDAIPQLIVCAVPYLRDRDIRAVGAYESIEDKAHNLVNGISGHYAEVCRIAVELRQQLGLNIPIIAMGHLFTSGGQTVDGDGVRELYVGSLAHIGANMFPACIDYLALGHLHVPQIVNKSEFMRYSGSPLAMGFGEATQVKSVCVVEFSVNSLGIALIKVPVFQALARIRGDKESILAEIARLKSLNAKIWLEILYESTELCSDLYAVLDLAVVGSEIQILRIKNNKIIAHALKFNDLSLDELDMHDVFARCLSLHKIDPAQFKILSHTYQEALTSLNERDVRSE